jgi:VanZ family protein
MGIDPGNMTTPAGAHREASARWSNRILLLALLGIAYLTLFPFRFDFSPTLVFHKSPLLLSSSVKLSGPLDFFLNVLLFVPFGFGMAAQARKRGLAAGPSFLLALAAGACCSYLVEVLQFYIPARDSGWGDVFTNTTGSLTGCLLFQLCGRPLLDLASSCEDALQGWLSKPRAALLVAAYFAVWFGISAHLQRETRLSNWEPQAILSVGNDASGQNPWRGQVFRLQIWSRALPEKAVREIMGGQSAADASAGLLGSYDFTAPAPYLDRTNFLPELGWIPEQPQLTNARAPELDGKSWLRTKAPVQNLNQEIGKSSQFTVHIVCTPGAIQGSNGRIVSLSQSVDEVNFHLRQQGSTLVFYFRNPLTAARSMLAWNIRGVFQTGQTRDIVAVYDGSDAFLYVDGNRVPQTYRLSPGASLMHAFYFIRPFDLEGCVMVYETLVFLPAGILIGAAVGKWSEQKITGYCVLALECILPAVLLEFLLAGMSGRRISAGNLVLSLVFGVAGILLVNADRRYANPPAAP